MVVASWARLRMPTFAVGVAELRFDCLRAEEQLVGGFLDGGAVGDDQRDTTLLEDQRVRGGGGWGRWRRSLGRWTAAP